MPGLCTLACVTATREVNGKSATATRDYLSSARLTPARLTPARLAPARLTPARFATSVRTHGAIENSPHCGSTSHSTRTERETARITGRKTLRCCENSP